MYRHTVARIDDLEHGPWKPESTTKDFIKKVTHCRVSLKSFHPEVVLRSEGKDTRVLEYTRSQTYRIASVIAARFSECLHVA